MRISKNEYYLKIAEVVAIRSTCLKHKYGAVIVSNDAIVATGYNGAPRGEMDCCDVGFCRCDISAGPINEGAAKHGRQYGTCVAVHAEANAIIRASHNDLKGAILYLVCLSDKENIDPCNYCDRLIKNAGISRVVTKGDII